MKKNILFGIILFLNISLSAEVYDFETNDLGWNEISTSEGEAIIKEGKLIIKGENQNSLIKATCFLPIDPQKPFELNVDLFVNKIKSDAYFGIIFNYCDDYNFDCFLINESDIIYLEYKENNVVRRRTDRIKFRQRKEFNTSMILKKDFDTVALIVDDVIVMKIPYIDYKYNGIGFYIKGEQSISIDTIETILK